MQIDIKISIIIPFQKENTYLVETIYYINQLTYKNIELILLPDLEIEDDFVNDNLKNICFGYEIIPTGAVSPAIKRDIGSQNCKGELLAFIDDDAYPKKDWLDYIVPHFQNTSLLTCAVGGPQITPKKDNFWQKVSGAMFLSILNGKVADRYFESDESYEVDDWPSVNLVIKKEDFLEVGGFDNSYWPGEDTKLCSDLVTMGKKIVYEPKAIVFHHRRSGFRRHMRQVGNYGLHRGYFAKKYPKTSLKFSYILPSLFFLFVIIGWVGLFLNEFTKDLYFSFLFLYFIAIIVSTFSIYIRLNKISKKFEDINMKLKIKNLKIAFSTIPYIISTHFWYGYRFLKGYFSKKLKEDLGR